MECSWSGSQRRVPEACRDARLNGSSLKRMAAALAILLVILGVSTLLNPSRSDFSWFLQLRRPQWLSFERWIPLIWIAIYACFYGSALLAWNASWSFALMLGYLGLMVLVQSYTWLICRTRRLANGTAVGLVGWLWGVALAVLVAPASTPAVWLLIPYLLWSPLGTLVTWQMQRINRP
jgi:tryptophan-rich sensory protein